MRLRTIVALGALALCVIGFSPSVLAQVVLELDAIVVEGRVQRPQASYIISRASLDFGVQSKRRSFVDKIVKTIDSDIF